MLDVLSKISNQSDIIGLNKADLINLLSAASNEAIKVEDAFNSLESSKEKLENLRYEKEVKSKVKIWVAIVGFIFYILPGLIYVVYKRATVPGKYDILIKDMLNEVASKEATGKEIAGECVILPLLPSDYRSSLALGAMIKSLSTGQAEDWKEASLRCDEQMHRWLLEQNSNEALELQKYSAMMSELTARNTRITAAATTFSAVSDLLK